MSNDHSELETAILYSKATITDIGKAVAYTDGNRLYINTEDNLYKLLPAYSTDFLKWLLWHEQYHIELRHPTRFFKYLKDQAHFQELKDAAENLDKLAVDFNLSHKEVNIIMDILVHDSLAEMFPDLVPIAILNCAQMRNRNSLKYTFKAKNLEDMLTEYSEYKKEQEENAQGQGQGQGQEQREGEGEGQGQGGSGQGQDDEGDQTEQQEGQGSDSSDTPEGEEGSGLGSGSNSEQTADGEKNAKDKSQGDRDVKHHGESKAKDGPARNKAGKDVGEQKNNKNERPEEELTDSLSDDHDLTDWSKLEELDETEFIDKETANEIDKRIKELQNMKIKLGRLSQQLNSLVTTNKMRTYRMPSLLQGGSGCIYKGKLPGKTSLYLVFDASGSMGREMKIFKDIITKSIPQAMNCPCEWWAGWPYDLKVKPYKEDGWNGYYKAKFQDFIPVEAGGGGRDDGDRVIELCYKAEQLGYSPIGVTDGGGGIEWTHDMIKQLKRTVLVGPCEEWFKIVKAINPKIQTINVKLN